MTMIVKVAIRRGMRNYRNILICIASLFEESIDTFLPIPSDWCGLLRRQPTSSQEQAAVEQLVEPTECSMYQQSPDNIDQATLDHFTIVL